MVCLGLEPGTAGWKAQTNPLSYGGTPPTVVSWAIKRRNNSVYQNDILNDFLV